MNIQEAAKEFIRLHAPEKIDVAYLTKTFGSVENYLEQEGGDHGDAGARYVEISQFDSVDGATKTVEWYEETYQVAFFTKPESERSSREDFTPEIVFEPNFDLAIDLAQYCSRGDFSLLPMQHLHHADAINSPRAYDVSMTLFKGGSAIEEVDLTDYLEVSE